MATATQVMDGLADVFDGITDLRGHGRPPTSIQPPLAAVIELHVAFDTAMQRGSDEMTAVTRLYLSGDARSAVDRLYELVSECRDAVHDDHTLGGVVADARVSLVRGDSVGRVTVQNAEFYVLDFETEVTT